MTEIMPKVCKNPFSTLLAHGTVSQSQPVLLPQFIGLVSLILLGGNYVPHPKKLGCGQQWSACAWRILRYRGPMMVCKIANRITLMRGVTLLVVSVLVCVSV